MLHDRLWLFTASFGNPLPTQSRCLAVLTGMLGSKQDSVPLFSNIVPQVRKRPLIPRIFIVSDQSHNSLLFQNETED